jgi:hypothetical protein
MPPTAIVIARLGGIGLRIEASRATSRSRSRPPTTRPQVGPAAAGVLPAGRVRRRAVDQHQDGAVGQVCLHLRPGRHHGGGAAADRGIRTWDASADVRSARCHPQALGAPQRAGRHLSRRWAPDHDRMLNGGRGKGSTLRQHSMAATSMATQALIPETTGRHQMKSVPLLSSQDGSGRVRAKG